MGVPKFFRWMSERYALCSQVVTDNQVPEFDNLYLDMNGIIHPCSHPSDMDVHFRITEEQIFLAIFNYVDHLFEKIRPRKLFFMAVDGVAPRAKMNQQRARRFRSAQEAQEAREQALRAGEELPEGDMFDSNAISPGTQFMARLSEQLRYFVHKKVTEDRLWRGVRVILSGHDVPGEGEHKIMDYIRSAKAQPDYDPNLRHCLYGLDADLIMLGLLSHEPHFALLREEVKFGKSRKDSGNGPASQKFYLMHLSLLREYLEFEFASLKSALPFGFSLERVIDDFVLMMYFVGNDFLPHLPNLHINHGALALLFKSYKAVLPTLDGYLHDHGELNLRRVQAFLADVARNERELIETEVQARDERAAASAGLGGRRRGKAAPETITRSQWDLVDRATRFVEQAATDREVRRVEFTGRLSARNRKFLLDLAGQLGIEPAMDVHEDESTGEEYPVIVYDLGDEEDSSDSSEEAPALARPGTGPDGMPVDGDQEVDRPVQRGPSESVIARLRILQKYAKRQVVDDPPEAASAVPADLTMASVAATRLEQKMEEYKWEYYRGKMSFTSKADRDTLVYKYMEGVQWVLYYYYRGVPAWGWFYPYHYGPFISDLVGLDALSFSYDIGAPLRPLEQLMGVLPAASAGLLPECLRTLMTEEHSPLRDFYPTAFETDMNGKKQSWEAIVLIPFIDAGRLLEHVTPRYKFLAADERKRNTNSEAFEYQRTAEAVVAYANPQPELFPAVSPCFCEERGFTMPVVGSGGLRFGLCPGVRLGADRPAGFPSLHSVPVTAHLGHHGVRVFDAKSQGETVVVSVQERPGWSERPAAELAAALLGERVLAQWPFLHEGLVVGVQDREGEYVLGPSGPTRLQPSGEFRQRATALEDQYSSRSAVLIGDVSTILMVLPLCGLKVTADGAVVKDYGEEEGAAERQVSCPAQLVVSETAVFNDTRYVEKPSAPVEQALPIGENVFCVATGPHYGAKGTVVGHPKGQVALQVEVLSDEAARQKAAESAARVDQSEYVPSHVLAKQLGITSLALSRMTSSLYVTQSGGAGQRVNVGLCLKFEGRGLKVLGYSRRGDRGWAFSARAVALVRRYTSAFPDAVKALSSPAREELDAKRLFPQFGADVSGANARLAQLATWVRDLKIGDLPRVPLNTSMLSAEDIRTLDAALPANAARSSARTTVDRAGVLRPSQAELVLGRQQTFSLGDRVVSVVDHGRAPAGARGTVVGLEGGELDVVFDEAFLEGDDLGGRCPAHRGLVVDVSCVLNLTRPQPPAPARARPLAEAAVFAVTHSKTRFTLRTASARPADSTHREIAPPASLAAGAGNAWSRRAARSILKDAFSGGDLGGSPAGPPAGVRPASAPARGRGSGPGGRGRGRGVAPADRAAAAADIRQRLGPAASGAAAPSPYFAAPPAFVPQAAAPPAPWAPAAYYPMPGAPVYLPGAPGPMELSPFAAMLMQQQQAPPRPAAVETASPGVGVPQLTEQLKAMLKVGPANGTANGQANGHASGRRGGRGRGRGGRGRPNSAAPRPSS